EQDDVADMGLIRQDHHEAVEAQSDAARRRHTVLEGPDEILVQLLRFLVPGGAQPGLLLEPPALLLWIIQLAERVRHFPLVDEQLPALHSRGIAPLEL